MFNINEYIIYGSYGVCRVEAVGKLDSKVASKGKLYYTLSPVYTAGKKIFTPIDNEKVVMRPILTREEADRLIDNITDIELLDIIDERRKEQDYREAIKSCDCTDLVKVIKTINIKKQARIAEGKKNTTSEDKYYQIAEDNLYGELAIPLEMEKQEVKGYILSRVNK